MPPDDPTNLALSSDGTQVDLSPGAAPPIQDTASSQADQLPLGEQALNAATSFSRGVVESLPFGDTILRNTGDLMTQLDDSPEWVNTSEQASAENQAAGWAGYLGAGLLQGGAGYQANTLRQMAAEGAVYGALEGGLNSIGEDMIENPGISAELMASHAIKQTLTRGGQGAMLAFGAGALFRGAGHLADGTGDLARRVTSGPSDAAVESAIRGIGDAPGAAARAARSVDTSPLGDLGQAVRRAEAEGVDDFVARVNNEVADDVRRAVSGLGDVAPPRSIWNPVANALDPAQAAAMERVFISARSAADIGSALTPTNAADQQILAAARQFRAVEKMGNIPQRMHNMSEGVRLMERSVQDASPEFQMIGERLLNDTRSTLRDESLWGRSATTYRQFGDAVDNIAAANRDFATASTPEAISKIADGADVLESIARLEESLPRPRGRAPRTPNATILESAQTLRSAVDRVSMARQVADVAGKLSKVQQSGFMEQRLGQWAARGVGGLIGGFPGAMVGDVAYSVLKDRGAARRAIWAAQNAYEAYTGRASQSLLRFVQQPRPAVNKFKFSPEDYRSAVDSVRAAAGNPSPRARSVKTDFVGDFSAVKPNTADIPMERNRYDEIAADAARYRRQAGSDTISPSQESGFSEADTLPPQEMLDGDTLSELIPSGRAVGLKEAPRLRDSLVDVMPDGAALGLRSAPGLRDSVVDVVPEGSLDNPRRAVRRDSQKIKRDSQALTMPPSRGESPATPVRDSQFYGPNAQRHKAIQAALGRGNGTVQHNGRGWWHVKSDGNRVFLGKDYETALNKVSDN